MQVSNQNLFQSSNTNNSLSRTEGSEIEAFYFVFFYKNTEIWNSNTQGVEKWEEAKRIIAKKSVESDFDKDSLIMEIKKQSLPLLTDKQNPPNQPTQDLSHTMRSLAQFALTLASPPSSSKKISLFSDVFEKVLSDDKAEDAFVKLALEMGVSKALPPQVAMALWISKICSFVEKMPTQEIAFLHDSDKFEYAVWKSAFEYDLMLFERRIFLKALASPSRVLDAMIDQIHKFIRQGTHFLSHRLSSSLFPRKEQPEESSNNLELDEKENDSPSLKNDESLHSNSLFDANLESINALNALFDPNNIPKNVVFSSPYKPSPLLTKIEWNLLGNLREGFQVGVKTPLPLNMKETKATIAIPLIGIFLEKLTTKLNQRINGENPKKQKKHATRYLEAINKHQREYNDLTQSFLEKQEELTYLAKAIEQAPCLEESIQLRYQLDTQVQQMIALAQSIHDVSAKMHQQSKQYKEDKHFNPKILGEVVYDVCQTTKHTMQPQWKKVKNELECSFQSNAKELEKEIEYKMQIYSFQSVLMEGRSHQHRFNWSEAESCLRKAEQIDPYNQQIKQEKVLLAMDQFQIAKLICESVEFISPIFTKKKRTIKKIVAVGFQVGMHPAIASKWLPHLIPTVYRKELIEYFDGQMGTHLNKWDMISLAARTFSILTASPSGNHSLLQMQKISSFSLQAFQVFDFARTLKEEGMSKWKALTLFNYMSPFIQSKIGNIYIQSMFDSLSNFNQSFIGLTLLDRAIPYFRRGMKVINLSPKKIKIIENVVVIGALSFSVYRGIQAFFNSKKRRSEDFLNQMEMALNASDFEKARECLKQAKIETKKNSYQNYIACLQAIKEFNSEEDEHSITLIIDEFLKSLIRDSQIADPRKSLMQIRLSIELSRLYINLGEIDCAEALLKDVKQAHPVVFVLLAGIAYLRQPMQLNNYIEYLRKAQELFLDLNLYEQHHQIGEQINFAIEQQHQIFPAYKEEFKQTLQILEHVHEIILKIGSSEELISYQQQSKSIKKKWIKSAICFFNGDQLNELRSLT